MNKYTNPFLTIGETLSTLKSLGADPLAPLLGATYPFPWGNSYKNIDWREHILSIMVQRVYEKGNHYYKIEIHLDTEGFDIVCSLMNTADEVPPLLKKKLSDEFDMHYIEPNSLLRLFKRVDVPGAQISDGEETTRGT